jgi:hypothetical protein
MAGNIHLPRGAIAPLPWQQTMIRVATGPHRASAYLAGVLADAANTGEMRDAIRKLAQGETTTLFIGGDGTLPILTLERLI